MRGVSRGFTIRSVLGVDVDIIPRSWLSAYKRQIPGNPQNVPNVNDFRSGFVVDRTSVMQVMQRFAVPTRASFVTDVVVEPTCLWLRVNYGPRYLPRIQFILGHI